MRLRGRTPEEVEAVRKLTEKGLTQKEIGKRTGVPARTQRAWKAAGYLGGDVKEVWPPERRWPNDWAAESLSDLPNYDRNQWENNIAIIHTAESQGNFQIG